MGQGQRVDLRLHALLVLGEEGIEGQLLQCHRLMPGLSAHQFGGMQAQGALVQGPVSYTHLDEIKEMIARTAK